MKNNEFCEMATTNVKAYLDAQVARYEAMSDVITEIDRQIRYYMEPQVSESGEYVKDEHGEVVYEESSYSHDRAKCQLWRDLRTYLLSTIK